MRSLANLFEHLLAFFGRSLHPALAQCPALFRWQIPEATKVVSYRLPLLRRERLKLPPAITQCAALLRRHLPPALHPLARDRALLR